MTSWQFLKIILAKFKVHIILICLILFQLPITAAVSANDMILLNKFQSLTKETSDSVLQVEKNKNEGQLNSQKPLLNNEDSDQFIEDTKLASEKPKIPLSDVEEMMNLNNITKNTGVPLYFYEEVPTQDIHEKTLEEEPNILEQFGYDIFNKDLSQTIDLNLPINDDYLLGVGDSLEIRMWGKIEQRFEVSIDKKGRAYLPKIGYVTLIGSSFREAEKIIKKELDRIYVNYDLNISMGELKTIKIFILGEVENPGAYDISSLSTLFTALHFAGGPTKKGSLRNIILKSNKKTKAVVDLYDYLLKGDNSNDPKLKNYDTIFVPPIGDVISLSGKVKRPGIYEIKGKQTTVYDAIYNLAGGMWAISDISGVKITRVNELKERLAIDLFNPNDKWSNIIKLLKQTSVMPNDFIDVATILDVETNTVQVDGEVFRPGTYELTEGMSMYELLQKAKGFTPLANKRVVKLFQFEEGHAKKVKFIDVSTKELQKNIFLKEWDSIQVSPIKEDYVYLRAVEKFKPGVYKLFHQMRLSDLLQLSEIDNSIYSDDILIEVVRKNNGNVTRVFKIKFANIKNDYNHLDNLVLAKNDEIFLRSQKKSYHISTVHLSGEVTYEGDFEIQDNESLGDLLKRAGGLNSKSFIGGIVLKRQNLKNIEQNSFSIILEKEKKRLLYDNNGVLLKDDSVFEFFNEQYKKSEGRVIFKSLEEIFSTKLIPGDIIQIPKAPHTVSVIGGVQAPRGVIYDKKMKPNDYINFSGGYSEYAKKNNFYVFKYNGSIEKNGKKISAGDVIYVPEFPKENGFFKKFDSLNKTLSLIVNTLSTVYLVQKL